MLHASLSLVEALSILERETTNKKFKGVILQIKANIEQGKTLSEAMAAHPKIFPLMQIHMIEAGEVAGKLDESLAQIVVQMKKTHALVSSIRGAMMYPAVVVTAMIAVALIMTTVILPRMIDIFKEFGGELPLPTRVLIAITHFMSSPLNLLLMSTLFTTTIVMFVMGLRKNIGFKRLIHSFNLNFIILGPVIKQINLARFSLTLSSLLKSTIPIIDAVTITSLTCTNVRFQESLAATAKEMKNGTPLSELLSKYPKLYPPMVTEMIMVGERTGEVERLLNELAEFYNEEVDKTMKNFTTIIEPLLIVFLGVAVGGVAVAVIMPMYSLANSF